MKSSLRTERYRKLGNTLFRAIQILTLVIIVTVAVCITFGIYNSTVVGTIIGMLILGAVLLVIFTIVVIML